MQRYGECSQIRLSGTSRNCFMSSFLEPLQSWNFWILYSQLITLSLRNLTLTHMSVKNIDLYLGFHFFLKLLTDFATIQLPLFNLEQSGLLHPNSLGSEVIIDWKLPFSSGSYPIFPLEVTLFSLFTAIYSAIHKSHVTLSDVSLAFDLLLAPLAFDPNVCQKYRPITW